MGESALLPRPCGGGVDEVDGGGLRSSPRPAGRWAERSGARRGLCDACGVQDPSVMLRMPPPRGGAGRSRRGWEMSASQDPIRHAARATFPAGAGKERRGKGRRRSGRHEKSTLAGALWWSHSRLLLIRRPVFPRRPPHLRPAQPVCRTTWSRRPRARRSRCSRPFRRWRSGSMRAARAGSSRRSRSDGRG